jgi:hypothetical protein
MELAEANKESEALKLMMKKLYKAEETVLLDIAKSNAKIL